MQKTLAALLLLALAAGCENRRADTDAETGAAEGDRTGVDTVIQTERVQDTTLIRADTTIDVDTLKQTDHIEEDKNP
jgi:hypothetical protein